MGNSSGLSPELRSAVTLAIRYTNGKSTKREVEFVEEACKAFDTDPKACSESGLGIIIQNYKELKMDLMLR
jgi:hypothetical protein